MKSVIFLMIALMLSGCDLLQEKSFAVINAKLPEGCSFEYLGNVFVEGSLNPSRVFLTNCNGKSTKTLSSNKSAIIQLDKIND